MVGYFGVGYFRVAFSPWLKVGYFALLGSYWINPLYDAVCVRRERVREGNRVGQVSL